jgi:hypothetical protein
MDGMRPGCLRGQKKSVVGGSDRLCILVVRVADYRSRGPGSIHGATRFSEE